MKIIGLFIKLKFVSVIYKVWYYCILLCYKQIVNKCSISLLYSVPGHFSYCHTIRRPKQFGQVVEVKTQITHRDFLNLLSQRDDSHFTIYKKRRCFLINNQYFQLDIYKEPGHPRYGLK